MPIDVRLFTSNVLTDARLKAWIIIGTPTGTSSQRTYLPALVIDPLKWGAIR
jgi:hypothetical protein